MPALGRVIGSWFVVCGKKQNVLTTNYELRTTSRKGFSLIEVLVSLGIIALLGAVAIPNLRNFSNTQEIEATAAQVVNILKTAQSSAISRIKCPNGNTTNTYAVRLTENNYSLIAKCGIDEDQIIGTYLYSSTTSEEKTTFSGSVLVNNAIVCSGQTIDVVFSKSQVGYLCFGSKDLQTGNISLTLTNDSNTLTKKVRIETGGVIKVE